MIATKFGMDMQGANGPDHGARGSRSYIARAVEASLRRLDTDYIDLYQIHQPDAATPIDETLAALDDLVTAGKVRYLGNSNFSGWQIADADWTARTTGRTPFISAQNEYSWLKRGIETEVIPACERFGLGMLPFFPLSSGLLTGKIRPRHHSTRRWPPLRGAVRASARRRTVGHDRSHRRVRESPRGQHPRRGDRRPGSAAGGHVGHRRSDEAGAGRGQRRRRRMDTVRRRSRRTAKDHNRLSPFHGYGRPSVAVH